MYAQSLGNFLDIVSTSSILKKVQTRLMVKQIETMSQLSATGHTISEWLEAQAEAGNSISNGEIYPPLFFEITHTILKGF